MSGELTGLFSLVGDSILAAVLIWFIWQFRTGQIMSKAVHDEIIEAYEQRIITLKDEASQAISELMDRLDTLAAAHVAICPFISQEATDEYLKALRETATRKSLVERRKREPSRP